ncbi:ATP-dependent Clp protease adaptor ClpS [Candidatus Sumerlaeota bacterium]|nr:ATP-dependent Clp protease adaptor ClpS [Candidatus Sumerlaeota bacterium]
MPADFPKPLPPFAPNLPAVIEAEPETVTETRKRPRKKHEPLWYVILHDDQLHSYDYVVMMLMKLFEMSAARAFLHAVEVDTQGVTIVARLPKEKAEQKRNEIMNFGGGPSMNTAVSMKASIEPCDD